MKSLIELPGDIDKALKEMILSQVNENLNKWLSPLIKEIDNEKGEFIITTSIKGDKLNVKIEPRGFSEGLTIRIKELLPRLDNEDSEKKEKVESSFDKLTNTDWWVQYMKNNLPFSAAKNETDRQLLQKNVYDENKVLRSFSQFKKFAHDHLLNNNIDEVQLRTEYELASRSAVMAAKWKRDYEDRDINPYWIYQSDDNSCEICSALNGLVMSFDDKIAQEIYPPNHFNCVCTTESTDDDENVISGEELIKYRDKISKEFQGNVGLNGIFRK
jgi:SPP1 gp7 family putative phage head morphogenesis protein